MIWLSEFSLDMEEVAIIQIQIWWREKIKM